MDGDVGNLKKSFLKWYFVNEMKDREDNSGQAVENWPLVEKCSRVGR